MTPASSPAPVVEPTCSRCFTTKNLKAHFKFPFSQFHIATHDNKKALLSIRKNGEEVASIFDQNHKDNHKNSMAGQSIVIDCVRGDEIVIYAYTGTWLADFPMNHYTHWVGILLKPDESEVRNFALKASLL